MRPIPTPKALAAPFLAAPFLAVALLAAVPAAGAAAAAEPLRPADYQRVNEALVADHAVPRYQALAEATAALDAAAASYCTAPDAATLAPLRAAFGEALDAWMGVQHLHFGPVELFMRSYRLYFWPQGRGRIADAVGELLSAADPAALEQERFRNSSTAIQGLPAVEVLLYGPEADARPSTYRCGLLTTITANMAGMAREIVADWQGGEVDFARTVAEPGQGNAYFETPQEATLAFFQSLYNGLELVADARLEPVLGESAAEAKPQLAESRLSGRSLRNVVLNLEALRALYQGEGGPGLESLAVRSGVDPELDALLDKAFRLTLENARGIEGPLAEAAADPGRRPALDKLYTQVTALKQIVRSRLSAAIDLAIGFNAMDGD